MWGAFFPFTRSLTLTLCSRDGDRYNLIWDPRLTIKKNNEPTNYPEPTPVRLDRPVTIEDTKKVSCSVRIQDRVV